MHALLSLSLIVFAAALINVITATQALCPYVSTTFGERRSLLLTNDLVTNRRPRVEELSKFTSYAGCEVERAYEQPQSCALIPQDVVSNRRIHTRYRRWVERQMGDEHAWTISLDESCLLVRDNSKSYTLDYRCSSNPSFWSWTLDTCSERQTAYLYSSTSPWW